MSEQDDFALLEARLADDSNVTVIENTSVPSVPEVVEEVVVDSIPEPIITPIVVEKTKPKETRLEMRIRLVKEVAEEIHGGNWDFIALKDYPLDYDSKYLTTARFALTIHFPEFVITNSRGHIHTIRDLYVRMYFNSSMSHLQGWFGTRSTYSYPEFKSKYGHSHLPTITSNDGTRISSFGRFCLGGDSDTGSIVSTLTAEEWNIEEFKNAL